MSEFEHNAFSTKVQRPFLAALIGLSALTLQSCESSRVISTPAPIPTPVRSVPTPPPEINPSKVPSPPVVTTPSRFPPRPTASPWIHVSETH